MVFDLLTFFAQSVILITMIARTSDIAHDHLSTKSTDLAFGSMAAFRRAASQLVDQVSSR